MYHHPLKSATGQYPEGRKEPSLSYPASRQNTSTPVTIPLERLLIDAYEFHGLKELGLYFLYFATFVVFVWFQWSSQGAEFRSSVVEGMRNWDTGNPWETSDLKKVASMEDAVQHVTGYLEATMNRTVERELPDGIVFVGDYGQVQLASLFVEVDVPNCNNHEPEHSCIKYTWSTRECISATLQANLQDRMLKFGDSKRWKPVAEEEGKWQAVIVTRNDSDATQYNLVVSTQSYLNRIREIAEEDLPVLVAYAHSIKLQTLLTSAMGPDVVFAELVFKFNSRILNKGLKPTLLMLTVSVQRSWILISLGIVCLLFCIHMMRRELRTWWLCYCQSGSAEMYFKFVWNWIQLFSLMSTTTFLIFYMLKQFALTPADCGKYEKRSSTELGHLRRQAKFNTLYLYFGISIMGLQGFAMVRYMRVHPGLKSFYQVFVLAFDTFKDFAVFVLYMFLVLGLLVFGMFQISGGNEMFVDYGTGLSAMARLQFDLLDFEEFTNLGLGFGRYKALINFMFWISVVLLVVFVANILLAIFQFAYEKVKQRSVVVESSFPWLVLQRIFFNFLQAWFYVVLTWTDFTATHDIHWKDEEKTKQPYRRAPLDIHQEDEERQRRPYKKPKIAHIYLHRILDKYEEAGRLHGKPVSEWDQLQARWLVAKKSTLFALTALYTSYKDLRLVGPTEVPDWLGREHEDTRTRGQGLQRSASQRAASGPVPFKTKQITRYELVRLLDYIVNRSHVVEPQNFILRKLMAPPHFHHLQERKISSLADTIMRVYRHTEVPKRGGDDEEVLNEEAEDPNEKILEQVQTLSNQLAQVMQAMQRLEQQLATMSGQQPPR